MGLTFLSTTSRVTGPDDDGDFRVKGIATVKCDGVEAIDQLVLRHFIRNADDIPFVADRQVVDDELDDGDEIELTTSTWAKSRPEGEMKAILLVEARSVNFCVLGNCKVPTEPGMTKFSVPDLPHGVVVVGSALTITGPDSDDDYRVGLSLHVENRGTEMIRVLELQAVLRKRNGGEMNTFSAQVEYLTPGDLQVLEGYSYVKSRLLKKQIGFEAKMRIVRTVATARTEVTIEA